MGMRSTPDEPRDGVCGFCGILTNSWAANPGEWPLWFPHPGDEGKPRPNHVRCVTTRLFPRDVSKRGGSDAGG